MPIIFQKFWHLFLELFCAEVAPKVRYPRKSGAIGSGNHFQLTMNSVPNQIMIGWHDRIARRRPSQQHPRRVAIAISVSDAFALFERRLKVHV
jgi:hypothetical protein